MKQLYRYRNEELNEKELDDFTRKIIQDKFRKEKKNKWAQQLEKDHGVVRSEKKTLTKDRNFFGKYFLRIAASILFITIAFFVFQENSSSLNAVQFADNYLKENKFVNAIATKGSSDIPVLELKMAEAYNKGNFSEAIEIGEELMELNSARSNNYFFLGLSYLYNKDLQNAQNYLSHFKQNDKTDFAQESRWFLALTYTKLKDWENAKLELQYIIDHQTWKFKEAEKLLESLNKMEEITETSY